MSKADFPTATSCAVMLAWLLQVPPYRFESGRLVLSDAEKNDPAVARWKIVWEEVE